MFRATIYGIERRIISLRHNPRLEGSDALWNRLRPVYEGALNMVGRRGLLRRINGTDSMLVNPRFRGIATEYETEVWKRLMGSVKPGDVVADVGAHIGLYSVALAKRVGEGGRVYAFEPDRQNRAALLEHVRLNGVAAWTEVIPAAAGNTDGRIPFLARFDSESHISPPGTDANDEVVCVRLDRFFDQRRVDILKIDVEGYEEKVLLGAAGLLSDRQRGPRLICLEAHPYAWAGVGTTSESLLGLLNRFSYRTETCDGQPVTLVRSYGGLFAMRVAA